MSCILVSRFSSQNTEISCGKAICEKGICEFPKRSQCTCNIGYKTFPTDSLTMCNYEQKKWNIAFYLELLMMFGIGHIYLGKFGMGIAKFILFAVGICLIVVLRVQSKTKEEYNKTSIRLAIMGCTVLCVMIWWEFFDILMFILKKYKDSNDIELL